MKTKELTRELIDRWGEETQMEMIINSSHELGMALQDYKFKKNTKDCLYTDLSDAYNEVCERIGKMRIMMDSAEFLFNKNEIEKHEQIMIQNLKHKLSEY
jgi:NADH/NAD ratio-sensing transcriptional regulator Rex